MAINTAQWIERERYGKMCVFDMHPAMVGKDPLRIMDLDLTPVKEKMFFERIVPSLQNSKRIKFAWKKGNKTTIFVSNVAELPTFTELLNDMGIKVNWAGKTEILGKRFSRLLSPRDVVVRVTNAEFIAGLNVVGDMDFTAYEAHDFTADQAEMLMDGPCAVKESWVKQMCHRAGVPVRRLRNCEALSVSIVYEGGLIKALAYIVADEDWQHGDDKFIATAKANIKDGLYTIDTAYVAFDIFHAYGQPKTNGQLDVMLRSMLINDHGANFKAILHDTLLGHAKSIKGGDAVKSIQDWHMPSLDRASSSSNKVSEEFAALSDMAQDFNARGMQYKWSPTFVDMLRSSVSSMYWSDAKSWPYYPLICSKAVPVITESAAHLIGEDVTVNRGEIKSIRDGEVYVVDDMDFVEYISTNAGGSDGDDHYVLIQRAIEGVKKVMVTRIPMSLGEFSILNHVEGDPVYEYTTNHGDVSTFPVMSGNIIPTLTEGINSGAVVFTGLPEVQRKTISNYNLDNVIEDMADIVVGQAANVGTVVNAIILAASERPELLNSMPTTMEGCIDAFTKGGAMEVRQNLLAWANYLVHEVGSSTSVDKAMWLRRAAGSKLEPELVDGLWTEWVDNNINLRNSFTKHINEWNQANARKGNPLIDKMEKLFNCKRHAVYNSTNEMIRAGISINRTFNNSASEMTKQRGGKMDVDAWRIVYRATYDQIMRHADGDMKKAELLALVTWFTAMSIPNKSNKYNDKSVMNTFVWKLFVQGLVNFGLAMDIGKLAGEKENPWTTNFNMACGKCDRHGTTLNVRVYAAFVWQNSTCSQH